MADEDDHLRLPSVWDADEDEDEDEDEDLSETQAFPNASALPWESDAPPRRAPKDISDWLEQVDWPRALKAVADAERECARLGEALGRREGKRGRNIWRRRALLNEAVSQTRIGGLVTTRLRLRVLDAGQHLGKAAPGDLSSRDKLRRLEALYADGVPENPTGEKLVGSGLARRSLTVEDVADGYVDPPEEEDGVAVAEALDRVLSDAKAKAGKQPPVVAAAAALWQLENDLGRHLESAWNLGLSLTPILLRVGAASPPLPIVFPSVALLDRPAAWRPGGDPTKWMVRFAEAIARSASLHLGELGVVRQKLKEADEATATLRGHARHKEAAAALVEGEILTSSILRRTLGWSVTDRAVRGILRDLATPAEQGGVGIAREVTGRKQYRIYVWHGTPASELQARESDGPAYAERASDGDLPPIQPDPIDRSKPWKTDDAFLRQLMEEAEDAGRRARESADREMGHNEDQ